MQLLLAEDDEVLSREISKYFTRLGHEVVIARDGLEAINCIRRQYFDCVVTDIYMPERDGLEVIRYLVSQALATRIVAISGMAGSYSMDCLKVARHFGAHATLKKPFYLQQLDALLEA